MKPYEETAAANRGRLVSPSSRTEQLDTLLQVARGALAEQREVARAKITTAVLRLEQGMVQLS